MGNEQEAHQAPAARYVSPEEASKIVGLSTLTVRRAYRAGMLRAYRIGRSVRIDLSELHRWARSEVVALESV